MFTQTIRESPRNERGGQASSLLLSKGQFGSANLSITWVEGETGSEQQLHAHPRNEQVYVIVRGRGLMTVEGEGQEVRAGTMIFIPPGMHHAIRNIGAVRLVYVSATSPPFDLPRAGSEFEYR